MYILNETRPIDRTVFEKKHKALRDTSVRTSEKRDQEATHVIADDPIKRSVVKTGLVLRFRDSCVEDPTNRMDIGRPDWS